MFRKLKSAISKQIKWIYHREDWINRNELKKLDNSFFPFRQLVMWEEKMVKWYVHPTEISIVVIWWTICSLKVEFRWCWKPTGHVVLPSSNSLTKPTESKNQMYASICNYLYVYVSVVRFVYCLRKKNICCSFILRLNKNTEPKIYQIALVDIIR